MKLIKEDSGCHVLQIHSLITKLGLLTQASTNGLELNTSILGLNLKNISSHPKTPPGF